MANPRIDELRKRLEKDPASRLFAQLAEELRKDGQLADAIQVCRDGLGKHPAYPAARMTLGRALLDGGDFAGAKAEFEQVVKASPDNGLAHRFLAECCEGLGDTAAAVERYRAALMFAPGDVESAGRLAALTGAAAVAPRPPAARAAAPATGPRTGTGPVAPAATAAAAAPRPAMAVPARQAGAPPGPAAAQRPVARPGAPAPRPVAVAAPAPRPAAARPVPPPAPPPPPAEEPPAPVAEEAPPPPVVPIPLSAADDSFELESAHDAARWAAPAAAIPEAAEAADAEVGAPETAEAAPVAPIKLVELSDDESFELERPGEAAARQAAPAAPAAPVPAAASSPAVVAAREEAEFDLDVEAPAAGSPAPVPEAVAAAPPLASNTLAELYLQQGARVQAEAVLKEVLAREPGNARAIELASEVAADPVAGRRAALQRTIERLERLLGAVQRARA